MPTLQYSAKIHDTDYCSIQWFVWSFPSLFVFLHSNQQLAQKEKMLKDEVEEMKATLSCTEEGRARASAHSKHVVS